MKYSTEDIEKIIYPYLPVEEGYPETVITAMNYAFRAGGKRLRPMMMKLCFDLFSKNAEDSSVVGPFMAAIEMIHTYSLIHDDLPALDNDVLRRGLPTVHVKFGEDIAILAGDGLLNYAFETAAKAFLVKPGDINIEKAFMLLASKPGIFGMIGIVCIMKWKKDAICNENLKKGEIVYIIVFSVLSLLLGVESFVSHFVAFVFGIIVGLLLEKKSKCE